MCSDGGNEAFDSIESVDSLNDSLKRLSLATSADQISVNATKTRSKYIEKRL